MIQNKILLSLDWTTLCLRSSMRRLLVSGLHLDLHSILRITLLWTLHTTLSHRTFIAKSSVVCPNNFRLFRIDHFRTGDVLTPRLARSIISSVNKGFPIGSLLYLLIKSQYWIAMMVLASQISPVWIKSLASFKVTSNNSKVSSASCGRGFSTFFKLVAPKSLIRSLQSQWQNKIHKTTLDPP